MENGTRTLNIASLNPDSMREKGTQQEIVKGITENKIHISAIQETHITRACNYMMGNYRGITAAAENNETGIVDGGTSIMIHGSLQQNIAKIMGKSRRVIRVTLDRAKSKMPIHIISTYAARNGHTEETKSLGGRTRTTQQNMKETHNNMGTRRKRPARK